MQYKYFLIFMYTEHWAKVNLVSQFASVESRSLLLLFSRNGIKLNWASLKIFFIR